MTGSLSHRVALITGGGSGFGRQAAIRLAQRGALVCVSDINADRARETAEIAGNGAYSCSLDVTARGDWEAALRATVDRFGKVDVLVNSAGVDHLRDNVSEFDDATWRHVFGINLGGTYLGCKLLIPEMRRAGGGAIINLSSILGMRGDGGQLAYCASKGGVSALTKSVAAYCAARNDRITCNAICPGYMMTNMVRNFLATSGDPERERRRLEAWHPIGRLGDADDVAEAVAFLASEGARFITGTALAVDGGFTAV